MSPIVGVNIPWISSYYYAHNVVELVINVNWDGWEDIPLRNTESPIPRRSGGQTWFHGLPSDYNHPSNDRLSEEAIGYALSPNHSLIPESAPVII